MDGVIGMINVGVKKSPVIEGSLNLQFQIA